MILRRQLPVYSPLSLAAVLAAAAQAFRLQADPRERLRELLRRRFDKERVLLFGSGTEALQVAIDWGCEIRGGSGAVALPAYTCFDVGAAAVATGLPIMLYDVDPTTLSPDFESLESRLRGGARVAVISPLYGVPVDWDAVEACTRPHGAVAIEDAAQGHGASWRGHPVGSFGTFSVLSFGRGKGWTGIRGGALLLSSGVAGREDPTRHGANSDLAILLAAVAQWALGRPSVYGLPAKIPWLRLGETQYRPAGPVADLPRAAAALLDTMAGAADSEVVSRRRNAEELLAGIKRSQHVCCPILPRDSSGGFIRLPLRLAHGLTGFSNPRTARRLGVARSYPSTLAELPAVRSRMVGPLNDRLGSVELARQLFTVPTHSRVTMRDQYELLQLINNYRL